MNTLIKFYDSEILYNILSVHCMTPARCVYLYDPAQDETEQLHHIRQSLTKRFPAMDIALRPISYHKPDTILKALSLLHTQYPDMVLDCTGGNSHGALVCASHFCHSARIPHFSIDYPSRQMLDLGFASALLPSFHLPTLYLEDFIEATGASISGHIHMDVPEEDYDHILPFFYKTVEKPEQWQQFCWYLQSLKPETIKGKPSRTKYRGPRSSLTGNGRLLTLNMEFLQLAHSLGFIHTYNLTAKTIELTYASPFYHQCLTSQGVWLEMYVHILAKRSGLFAAHRMSVIIDWDGPENDFACAVNEIDALLISGATPVFISCKSSVPSTAALNEIELYAKRFGGSFSKTVMITTCDIQREAPTILKRAQEMKITLIDRHDLHESRFLELLQKLAGGA